MAALRDYQTRGLSEIALAWRSISRRVLYVLPTGGGKTRVGVEACLRTVGRGGRALWLVHGVELVKQGAGALRKEGLPSVGVLLPGVVPSPDAPVQVASIDTLRERGWELGWSPRLVVCDEAHHFRAAGYEQVLALFPSAFLLGLTATPQRADGKPLGDIFQALVVGPSVKELQKAGCLVEADVWSPPEPTRKLQLAEHPVTAYLKNAAGRRTVVYSRSVTDARLLVSDFRDAGVPVGLITGETPGEERELLLQEVAAGLTPVIVNCGVLTEGVDVPSLEVALLARSVGSQALFLQMVGRVLRPSPKTGKRRALVLDLAGSVLYHGLPDAERAYSLDGLGISLVKREGEELAVCPTCGLARTSWPCPRCGHTPVFVAQKVAVRKKKLAEATHEVTEAHRKKALEALIRKAIHGKHKPGFVWYAYASLFSRKLTSEEWAEVRRRLQQGAAEPAGPPQ